MHPAIHLKTVTRFQRNRFFTSLKHISGVRATQRCVTFTHCDPVTFRQTNNCEFWRDDQQFANTLFTGFTFMAFRQRVGEVRVDLQREQI